MAVRAARLVERHVAASGPMLFELRARDTPAEEGVCAMCLGNTYARTHNHTHTCGDVPCQPVVGETGGRRNQSALRACGIHPLLPWRREPLILLGNVGR